MRLLLLPIIIVIILNVGVDTYILRQLRLRVNNRRIASAYFVSCVLLLLLIIVAVALPRRSIDDSGLVKIMWMLYTYLTFYIPKYFYLICDFIMHLPKWIAGKSEWKWGRTVGVVLSFIIFGAMWWGSFHTRNYPEVTPVELEFSDLPQSFDGFRIVQISDLHVGSRLGISGYEQRLVNRINELDPDLVLFTGDIVNRHSGELKKFAPVLARVHGNHGTYSVLGNHDYGDYMDWETPQAKQANMQLMLDLQKSMGWHLLNNRHVIIRHKTDSIVLIGVENWGDPPFPVYGDLKKAYPNLNDSCFKILMTHNPAHWKAEVVPETNIQLSLSGHTHAMQIEFDFFGVRLSPAVWRYKEWGGVYRDGKQLLYVNIGAGEVALPMRIGASPEITLITLRKK